LGEEEVRLTKRNLGWPEDKSFYIPDEALRHFRKAVDRGADLERTWQERMNAYRSAFPEEAKVFERCQKGELPEGWQAKVPVMTASLTGMARHGGVLPYGATFLTFSDYMRPAVRLAALSKARAIYVWTHDSIALGEDGPTHQPVEHLPSLRAIPNLIVLRPADATETAEAWRIALQHAE